MAYFLMITTNFVPLFLIKLIFKIMKLLFSFLVSLPLITNLVGCAGSNDGANLEVPTDMPPICRGIDFVAQPDMREVCGVRSVRYKAYRNIPQQRYLIKPTETSLVKVRDKIELRFPNTLPIILEGAIVTEIQFNQDKRLEKIKNSYDYYELYNEGRERIRIFKMGIPTDAGTLHEFCFRVPEKLGNERTRSVAMGNRIEAMTCEDFNGLLTLNGKKLTPKHFK